MIKKTFFNSLLRITKRSINSDVVTIIVEYQNTLIRRIFSTAPLGYLCLNEEADLEYTPTFLGKVVVSTLAIIPAGVKDWTIAVCALIAIAGAVVYYFVAKLDEKYARE